MQPNSDLEKVPLLQARDGEAERLRERRKMTWRALILWGLLWIVMFGLSLHDIFYKYFRKPAHHVPIDHDHWRTSVCAQTVDWKFHDTGYQAHLTYTLPKTSDLLYFVNQGTFPLGRFYFVNADEGEEDVVFNLTAGFNRREALDKMRVCELGWEPANYHGIGIFGPDWTERIPIADRVNLVATVKLPQGKYRELKTDLVSFEQYFWATSPPLDFDSVTLKTVNASISVPAVQAKHITIRNVNGHIDGWFNATDSIYIENTNAVIKAITFLGQSEDVAGPSNMTIKNTNGLIASDIILYSREHDEHTERDYGGKYNIAIKATHLPSEIRFRNAPINSILNLVSEAVMTSTSVKLHETFEGDFALHSASFHAPVVVIPSVKVEDPAGWGRERYIWTERVGKGSMKGAARWLRGDGEDEERELGNVTISTSGPWGSARLLF